MPRNPVNEICVDLTNAYEAHDRRAFDEHLVRLRRMLAYTGPLPPAAPVPPGPPSEPPGNPQA